LDFVLSGDEGIAWWEGLNGLCTGFGLRIRYLEQAAIEELTRWMFSSRLDDSQVSQEGRTHLNFN
jgi:hypothetical protein